MNKNNALLAATFLASMLAGGSARAGLTGDTVTTKLILNSDPAIEVVSTVGADVEGRFFGSQIFDYSDFGFSIRSIRSFCGMGNCPVQGIVKLRLEGLNFGEPLTGVTFTSLLQGVSVSRGSDFVQFSWADQSIPGQTYISAQFVTGVPELETHALMLAGLGLVGFAAARRR
ncbi:MAG TPA: hypothetical protein VIO81_03065 [Methyloversatilis sp.]